jgi:ATP-dependent exoDNAse (exonuclease V) beta subunit
MTTFGQMTPSPQTGESTSLIVEASAGTGKTRELVNRIASAVIEGCDIETIVAVTFTFAAAGEMKLRLRQELDRRRQDATLSEAAQDRASAALQHLERAFIGTIHSFCALLLRQRPVEARIDPAFEEMAQPDAYALFSQIFQRWIEQRLASPPAAFRRLFARLSLRDGDPVAALKNAAWQLAEWRDFPASWRREKIAWQQEVDDLMQQIATLLQLRAHCDRPLQDALYRGLQPVADCHDRYVTAAAIGRADYDAFESDLLRLPEELRWLKTGWGAFSRSVSRDAMVAAWEQLRAAIQTFSERSGADLAAALRDELWPVVLLYQDAKQRLGKLDFADLLICARELLHHDEALAFFRSRYRRIFVDEFQDTDPLQAEILLLLSGSDPEQLQWESIVPGNLFLVGDPKQSIYRFRRADVELYRRICGRLAGSGVALGTLSESRRSIAPIQEFVNAAFEEMPGYIPLTKGRDAHPGQPAIIALPMPKPYGRDRITKTAINACAPATVAAFIDWLLARKWRVSDREDSSRTRVIEPSDICILFRRFTNFGVDLTAEYVRCLEARNIRHVLVGSKSFHSREEVVAIRTALRAIEWPDDELSVFATLRGSLFAVQDGTLLKFRAQYGPLRPYLELPEDLDPEFAPIADALTILNELHRARNYRPIADSINRLLEHCRAHAGFAFRKGGERVLANVLRLTDLSRQFEVTSATSFRSFIDYLESQETAREASDPTVLEQEGDGVRLMTVHRAKGLEFPVVILADLTCRLTSDRADRVVDPGRGVCAQTLVGLRPWELLDPQNLAAEQKMNREEGERIAYVAATRARDLLVVSALGERDRKLLDETWLSPLYDALYPPDEMFRTPAPAEGCNFTGHSTVLEKPLELSSENSVKPGVHDPCRGTHRVVWFDPAALNLNEQRPMGLQYEDVLTGSSEAGLQRYEGWRTAQKEIVDRASRPQFEIRLATEGSSADSQSVELVRIEKRASRPSGRAFGKLVHALLQQAELPVSATNLRANLEAIAQVESRILDSSEADIGPAIETALDALLHPLLESLSTAARIHREFPILLRQGDKLIEGVIDLAFTDGATWTIVDFKTGPADKKRNRGQLELYRQALAQATGLPVRPILFEI